MELRTYLHNQLLRDTDIMGMAHGVEIRAPFLDTPFAEAALSQHITRRQFCRQLGIPRPGPKRGFTLSIGQVAIESTGNRDLGTLNCQT